MGRSFPQEFIEAVRDAGDIVRVVSDYVPLRQAGARHKGLCPFHQEKTPSFSVDASAQLFYCFGCQTGGDLFRFVQLYEKVSFPEAVELLARRFGVPLPEASSPGSGAADRVLEANRLAQAFFRTCLADPECGRRCRDYIARRGLDEETVERLALGYAPDSWTALSDHLAARRFRPEELLAAGLVSPRKTGGHYDRFRDRLIFPIRDVSGRVVAFGGRTLGNDDAKYINSPETAAYTKGDHLYGLDVAREAIRREGHAIVVEGNLDLAVVSGAGFHHVVASLGTSFTPGQARLLARYTNRVVFSYDGDAAGAKATERSFDMLIERGFQVRVVELPDGLDPDDTIQRHGAAAYGDLVRQAPDYLDYLVRKRTRGRRLGTEEQVETLNEVLPHVARLASPLERAARADRLADALGVDDALVMDELRRAVRSGRTTLRQAVAPGAGRLPSEAECRLVSRLLSSKAERARWAGELGPEDLEGLAVAPLAEAILTLEREGAEVDPPAVLERLADDDDRLLLTRIAFRDEPVEGPSVEDCLDTFRRVRVDRSNRRLRRELHRMQEASMSADAAEVQQRLMRVQESVLARMRQESTFEGGVEHAEEP